MNAVAGKVSRCLVARLGRGYDDGSAQVLQPSAAMWRLDIPQPLVHGVFFISLTTTAGLLAVWAALSPRHRLLRVLASRALPLALWLASAPELVSHLLVEMAVIAISIIAVPLSCDPPYGRTYAKLPKFRFGLATLFYATFLVALILAAASLLGPQFAGSAPKHFVWLVEPISLSAAIIGATAFAQGAAVDQTPGGTLRGLHWRSRRVVCLGFPFRQDARNVRLSSII